MDEKSLKTTRWQRIGIIAIAILLLGGTVFTYLFIFMSGSSSSSSSSLSSEQEELIADLTEQYDAKAAEITAAAAPLSDQYFDAFSGYLSEVKAYNAASAEAEVLGVKDLKTGTGKTLEEGDTDYFAYYIGWCADGSIFDSSFDDTENPTALNAPLDASVGLIEGWNQGVVGMKLGGVRQLTISGDLAYGDTQEICGGYNSPLKFIILAIEPDAQLAQLQSELEDIYNQLYMVYYGSQL